MHEQLATVIELLSVLLVEMQAGVPVVMVRKQKRKGKPLHWPRPSWIEQRRGESSAGPSGGGEIVVQSPGALVAILKGKSG